ncbi:unnamed protein product [Clonostachys rosea]|uniref:Phosphatidylinositol-specific phospholipase C X domain-containing protein n=1 Tax=Bionectria ochroleuca TaxID=29856 RepID=A0ABY6TVF3_BIOOC|nr:unnamed protein product [Clonostachys rosea]
MLLSKPSLLAILAAALAIGSPIPETSEAVATLDQPNPVYVSNAIVEDASSKTSLPILPTGESMESPGPNIGQYGVWRSHMSESAATTDMATLKRRGWSATERCQRELYYQDGQCIEMINATPYRWRRGYHHSSAVSAWEKRWPEYIEPGEVINVLAKMTNNGLFNTPEDSAAEVAYHIEGTDKPMSFMLEYRSGLPHVPWIRFLEDLEVMNHHKGAEFSLGGRMPPYGVPFILAGTEGDFVTNEGPAAWMQAQIDVLGDKPLREIVLGRSHHAGMWKTRGGLGGSWWNTATQEATLYDQLRNGGARVLDARIMRADGKFQECHGTIRDKTFLGSYGATFDELIEQTNQFNEDYPGELIIWDIHPDEAFRFGVGEGNTIGMQFGSLNVTERADFLELLKGLNHRISLPEDVDITKMPLKKFINSKDKKSAVIIRLDERWLEGVDMERWPGPSEGFVSSRQFPMTSTWSKKTDVKGMIEHQLQRMDEVGVSRTSEVYDMQWIQTLLGFGAVYPLGVSIISMANESWDAAFRELFNTLTADRYPNWLTMDAIQNSEMKTLVMTMNHCFALERCGDWVNKRRQLASERTDE